jgi:hypothetical protein
MTELKLAENMQSWVPQGIIEQIRDALPNVILLIDGVLLIYLLAMHGDRFIMMRFIQKSYKGKTRNKSVRAIKYKYQYP